jgi:ABC-type lipoprotein release transport system permease subunit
MAWYNLHPIRLWGGMAQAYIAYGIEPLMPLALNWSSIVTNVAAILIIVMFTCIFPVRRAFRFKVVEALHK